MKQLIAIVSMCLLMISINAQETTLINYNDAIKQASKTGKTIVIQFSGSDWCTPCIRLEKEIINTPEFEAFSKQFVWVKADFPRKKSNRLSKEAAEQNDKLAEQFNPQGHFPQLVFLDSKQEVKATIGYQSITATEYITMIKKMLK